MNKTNQTLLSIVLMFVMFLLAMKTFEEVKMLTSPKTEQGAKQEDKAITEAITEAEQKTERTWECDATTLESIAQVSGNQINRKKWKELRFPYISKIDTSRGEWNPWIIYCGK